MTEHEQNLKDLAAMFAMMGIIARGKGADIREIAESSYALAHELMEVREEWLQQDDEDQGIAAIKPKRKYERKSTD